jgi:hypothetical protein
LHRLLTALGVGLVAMSFTLFLVAAVIGELGVLSPLSTLLMTPLCTLSLVLSLLCLLLLPVGAGGLVGMLNGRICALMAAMAEGLGNPSFAVISLRHPAVLPLAVVMVAVTLGLLAFNLPRRRQKLILLPMLAGWVLIGGILGADGLLTRDRVELTYLQPSTQSDALVMVAGQRGFVCDLSNGSLSSMTASAREAERQGATELAAFMVTHYHSRTPGALWGLLNRETVRALWLPRPKGEEEYGLLLACVEKADLADVPVYLYEAGEALSIFGDGTVTLETASLSRSVQPILLVSVTLPVDGGREERLLYCGSAVFESGLADTAAERVAEADTVIFGSHGPLFKAPFGAGLDLSEAETVLLSRNGDTAAWFDPSAVPDSAELWLGPWRASLPRP